MSQISITFNTTAAQDAKLVKVLARVNEERTRPPVTGDPLAPYPTVDAWLKDFLISNLRSFVVEQTDRDTRDMQTRIANATPAQVAQIEAILGV